MNDEILISKEELANLNERIKKLAEEKSYLELFTRLMEKMSFVSGLENTIKNLLQILLENIGGSNVIIYYLIDNEIFYVDALGKKESVKEISDEIVKNVFETKSSVEQQCSLDDTKSLSSELTKTNIWAFPLQVDTELIAVIKIENLYVTSGYMRFNLPPFFSFVAHILKNEILGYNKLKTAYDGLTHENNLRKHAEDELRVINEELVDSIDARTIELQNVNTQLKEELEVQKQSESQIRKLNRIYAVLSNINQAIVRIRNTKDIFDETCRIAVEYGKFPMVWIGIVNAKNNKVDVAASSGVESAYLENLVIDLNDEQRSSGPTGIAIRTGKHKISNNIIDDDSMRFWKNEAIQYGYKSTASFPLIAFGKVVGAFCIYSDELNFFEDDDVVLLDEMVKDISFAMEFIESEEERKKAEEDLNRAAEEIRDLYNHAPCGYHSLDKDGMFVLINDTELEWLGYTYEEVIGKMKFTDIITPNSLISFKENFPEFKERGWVKDLEFELIRKDGTILPILFSATAIKDSDGNFLISRSTIYDISDLKKAELQLKNSEREFRTLAESLPDNIVRYNREGRTIYVNPILEKTLANGAAAMIGTTIRELNPDGSFASYAQAVDSALASGENSELEILVPNSSNEQIVHQIRIIVERNEHDEVTGVLAIGRDISERKLAEKERQANLLFFENMDKINRAIQEATDAGQMMSDVLDIILSTFDCDRASLIYPCDPEAASWKVPIEKTKPEYPGARVSEIEVPMEAEAWRVFKAVLATNHPVGFGSGNEEPLPPKIAESFNIKSQLAISLHPKINKAWMFVLHQCSKSRSWTSNERKLLKEISVRLTDGITNFITLRNLKESEERYRTLVEQAMDGIFIADSNGGYIDVNRSGCNMLGYTRDQLMKLRMQDLIPAEEQKTTPIQLDKLRSGKTALAERNLIRHDGSLLPVEISAIMLHDGRFLEIVRDITERKLAESTLNERIKHSQSLLRLSKNLELAQTYSQVLDAALNEAKYILGYQSLWVYLLSDDRKYFKVLIAGGDVADVVMSSKGTTILTIADDRMLEEIAEAKDIIIVEDAKTDERTNKEIVAALGNRTIINIPIYLFDKHLGTVGTGTFAPEGVRVPTHSEQEFLLAMASHLAVTLDRLHLLVERQEVEKALLRSNRELKAISNCNQSLLHAEDEQSLLNEICRIICEEAGYNFAWVGYTDISDSKTLRPVAWAGIDIDFKAKEKLDWSEEIDCGLKPAQRVIQTGDIIYVQDFNSDTSLESWCRKAIQRGYRSGMALPLKGETSQVFGVLLIYSINENVITPDEIRLIEELANDLAFGIITIQTRAERARVEKELELHRDHLQELVNVRTEELNKVNKKLIIEFEKEKEFERMLQHSLEKEKELSELKSRFISTTSHEFRTPLTTIRVSAEMIQRYRKKWSEEKVDEFIEKIKKSVDYLTKLLDDILTISRSESGKIFLNKEIIDFHLFCIDVIDEAKVSITEKHDLVFKYTLKEEKYNLDPKLMNFILLNLLSNAIKYSPNGGKIELTIKQTRGKLVIVVKDQGIGIPSDDLKHLFEPFHRAKNTTNISGTGLGLSIVKRAVELHGGIIAVKSQLGTGTAFTVNIPLNA